MWTKMESCYDITEEKKWENWRERSFEKEKKGLEKKILDDI